MSNRSYVNPAHRVMSDSEYRKIAIKSNLPAHLACLIGRFELDMTRPEPTVEEVMAELPICKKLLRAIEQQVLDSEDWFRGVWRLTRLRSLSARELQQNGGTYSPRPLTRDEAVQMRIEGKLLEANAKELLPPKELSASKKKELQKKWAETARRVDEPILTYFCWPPEAPPAQKQVTLKLA